MASQPYVKLWNDILDSSIWEDSNDSTLRVWMTLMLLADENGDVWCTEQALARRAKVRPSRVKSAIQVFQLPDPKSKNQLHEGRRLLPLSRGWHLVSYVERRERNPFNAKRNNSVTGGNNSVTGGGPRACNDSIPVPIVIVRERDIVTDIPEEKISSSLGANSSLQKPDEKSQPLEAKQDKPKAPTEPSSDLTLNGIYDAWYAKRLTVKGKPMTKENFNTFLGNWNKVAPDLDAFTNAVSWRLSRLDADDRKEATDYVGSLSNFLVKGTWKKETAPYVKPAPAPYVQPPCTHDIDIKWLPCPYCTNLSTYMYDGRRFILNKGIPGEYCWDEARKGVIYENFAIPPSDEFESPNPERMAA